MESVRFNTRGMRRSIRSIWSIMALAVAVAAGLATAAGAQVGVMSGFGEIFKEDFSRRDLPFLASGLDLDESQQFNVETLIEEYQEKIRTGVDKLRESFMTRQKDFTSAPGNPQAVAQLVFEPLEEWAAQKEQMKLQFVADLKEFLTEPQLERWPGVERKLNRLGMLRDGQISGEGTDLFLLVQELSLTPEQTETVSADLDRYSIEMDQLLLARAKALKEMRHDSVSAMQGGSDEGYRRTVERVITLRVAVRDVNEKYVEAIAELLTGEQAVQFRQAYREAAYPRVFRATRAERLIKAALESPLATAEQKALVQAMSDRYRTEMAAINETLIRSMKLSDPQRERSRATDMFNRMSGTPAPPPQPQAGTPQQQQAQQQQQLRQKRAANEDPLRDDFRKRDELENRYLMELAVLLGPETFDSLPGANKGGGAAAGKEPTVAPPTSSSGKRGRGNSGDGEGGDGAADKDPHNPPPRHP